MTPARILRAAALGLVLSAFGCAGLSPQKPNGPPVSGLGCGEGISIFTPLPSGLASVGTDTTLDLATWNLRFFPVTYEGFDNCPDPVKPERVEKTAEIINALNLDVIAVQEISSPEGFQQLLDLCPDYDGALISQGRGCNFQRTGVIYRTSVVTLNSSRALTELSVFTRDPFEVDMTATQSGRSYHFKLIVLHLKAGGEADAPRRRAETTALYGYLEDQAVLEPDMDYIVAGDWNDVLTDDMSITSFPAFLSDTLGYSFITDPLKNLRSMASIGNSLIDLILVNQSACPDFAGSRVSTLRLDLIVPGYSSLVSDHRPVMVQTPVFK